MSKIENIIQGCVFITLGFCILKLREKFIKEIFKSHESFWNKRLKFKAKPGRKEEVISRILLNIIGVSFLLGGLAIILLSFFTNQNTT